MGELPQHLIVEFWADVKQRLQADYRFSAEAAERYIALYRQRMQAHGGEEMAYHDGAENMARALSRGGVVDPYEPTPDEARRELVEHHPELAEFMEDVDSPT